MVQCFATLHSSTHPNERLLCHPSPLTCQHVCICQHRCGQWPPCDEQRRDSG
jgi:hypothetical protein